MKLATAIDIHAGGPGSGPRPGQGRKNVDPLNTAPRQPKSPEETGPDKPFICAKCGEPIVEGKEGFINRDGMPQHSFHDRVALEEYKNANNGNGYKLNPQHFPAWHK